VLRFVPSIFGLLVFGLMVLLYHDAPDLYFAVLRTAGTHPWPHPFIDSAFMYAMKDCWLHGVNVYNNVPCDHDNIPAGNLKMAYSPLWQRLAFLPSDDWARYPIGLATDALLLGSLSILPPAASLRDAVLLSLAAVSTMVCFALERNNIDVWIYLLAVAGGLLMVHGGRLRAGAYAVFMLAGLLKYYPLVLFGLAMRERPARFLLIAILSMAVTGLFAVEFWSEILEESRNIPSGSPYGDLVGITNIPMAVSGGARILLGASHRMSAALSMLVRLLLSGLVIDWAILTARRTGFTQAVLEMPEAQSIWLIMGCLIMGFCYLAGQSVGYRGIYLLIVLSGLLAMQRVTRGKAVMDDINFATLSVVVMMWMEAIRLWVTLCLEAIGAPSGLRLGVQVVAWLSREILWLNLERILLAVLISFAVTSLTAKTFKLRPQSLPPVQD
jgi:hypothetical protein